MGYRQPAADHEHFYSRPCGRGDDCRAVFREPCFDDFYSRPCGRGDVCRDRASGRRANFYSRPCGRGDHVPLIDVPLTDNFYSRPCGRGDDVILASGAAVGISTHAPAGGATWSAHRSSAHPAHFYSRPCGRGDTATTQEEHLGEIISTHAPAGGATQRIVFRLRGHCISTHAPAGGATASRISTHSKSIISTHAPAGGATMLGVLLRYAPVNFYSRPCGRGDRRRKCCCIRPSRHFYSRPCGRGDSNFPQVRHEVLRQIAER